MTAVDLANPFCHVVEEIAVVRDGKDRALVAFEELLEPQDGFGIQVVSGLVEQQQVRRLEEQAAQRHAATLAAGEHLHGHVGIGALQCIHGLGKLAVKIPTIRRIDFVLQLAHLVHERVEIGIRVCAISALTWLKRSIFARTPPKAIWTFSRTVFSSSRGGSCCRMPTVYPGVRRASPFETSSRPAMILSSVDLPMPLGPTTPILAPG